jgi:hypothetical protein
MTHIFVVRHWGGSVLGATLTLLLAASGHQDRADINQTTTFSSSSALNLDTGAVVSSGGENPLGRHHHHTPRRRHGR